jgi:hypothetical protein
MSIKKKQNMNKIEVSMFINCKSTNPIQKINLWDWLVKKSIYMPFVDEIRESTSKDRISFLKSQLPAITPSGIFSERKSDKLIKPTNLICIDIDGKDNCDLDMDVLKLELSRIPYIMYGGFSAGGKGLYCLIKIDDYQQHKCRFQTLEQEFEKMNVVIDSSCSDLARLRFYSYDKDPIINPDSKVFSSETEYFIEYCPESLAHIKIKDNFDALESAYRATFINDINPPHVKKIPLEDAFIKPTVTNDTIIMTHFQSKKQMAAELIKKVISLKVDITKNEKDWFMICAVIASLFGQQGRTSFHEISSFYPNYDPEKANHLYTYCLEKEYHPETEKLFIIARKYGIS